MDIINNTLSYNIRRSFNTSNTPHLVDSAPSVTGAVCHSCILSEDGKTILAGFSDSHLYRFVKLCVDITSLS